MDVETRLELLQSSKQVQRLQEVRSHLGAITALIEEEVARLPPRQEFGSNLDQEDEESGSLDGEVLVGVCQVSCNFSSMICYKRLTFIELVPYWSMRSRRV